MTPKGAGSRAGAESAADGNEDDGSRSLEEYDKKRSRSRTTEPFGDRSRVQGPRPGAGMEAAGGVFVVQKHQATSLHWDLRLEMDGVLASWAVPKGPSPNQADKRLAVHVEDHPLEYADFEGVIPEGAYGAGAMIVWDRGTWTPAEDLRAGWKKGKLLFDLRGYKLKGRWTLVRTKAGGGKHWLLIKERDAYEDAGGGTADYPDDSILSGLTVERLGAGGDFGAEIRERCLGWGASESAVSASEVQVMLAETAEEPFSRAGWVFEAKLDGYRLLAEGTGGTAALLSRNGNDLTATYPEVARALRYLPYQKVVLDGEVVVLDGKGIPSFALLQKRSKLRRPVDVAQAAAKWPATYFAFDLLAIDGLDARPLPLTKRKALLREVLPSAGPLRYSVEIAEKGEEVYRHAVAAGLEGVVGKRADSAYAGGRSPHWLKVRPMRTGEFAVHGFTEPELGSGGFGALHLAYRDGDAFVFAGRVGTGFSARTLKELGERLRSLPEAPAPKRGEAAGAGAHRWVVPEVVVEVAYKEFPAGGSLRQPAFLRVREDKTPEECVVGPSAEVHDEPSPKPPSDLARPATPRRTVSFSNLDKPFWPEDGYVKGDLVEYYRAVAPWLLPHLAERPVVLTRYPDGIHGKSFYQKNAPDFAPPWIRRVRIYSEGSGRELDYFVADDLESLLWVANSASIPLHIWPSRTTDLARPDYCVLDLDPNEAPFAGVIEIALFLKEVCDQIDLPAFVKTSGSTGLHVMIPLGRQFIYEQSRNLGHVLALAAVREMPKAATVARRPSQREGKVYVDYLQNGHGRLIAAPYSVRPLPGAPVSAPLDWDEVNDDLSIADHTIKTTPPRMAQRKVDPLDGLLDARPRLADALDRLRSLLG